MTDQQRQDVTTAVRVLRLVFRDGYDHASEGLRAIEGWLRSEGRYTRDEVEAIMEGTAKPLTPPSST